MLRAVFVTASLAIAPVSAFAQATDVDRLLDAMGVAGIIDIMRDEGMAYGTELADQAVPGGPNARWNGAVDDIYDTERMAATVQVEFAKEIGDADLTDLLAFFEGEAGQQVITLELSARAAMMDEAVEEAAKETFRNAATGAKSDRMKQIDAFVDVNDLIEANVVGALNSNIVFYRGLADGGASELTDEDILRDVWAQEEETRTDTREWVYGFLLMAYKPLPDEVLDTYIDLSRTDAGSALNRALFAGFDRMYADISYALGLALAREMQVQEL